MRGYRNGLLLGAMVVAVVVTFSGVATAQENATAAMDGPLFSADGFKIQVEKNATADELVDELQRIAKISPLREFANDGEMREFITTAVGAAGEVIDRLLSAKPTEEQAEVAVEMLFNMDMVYRMPLIGFSPDEIAAFKTKYMAPLPDRLRGLGFVKLAREPQRIEIFHRFQPIEEAIFRQLAEREETEATLNGDENTGGDDENTDSEKVTESKPMMSVEEIRTQFGEIVDAAIVFVESGKEEGLELSGTDATFLRAVVSRCRDLLEFSGDEQDANRAFVLASYHRVVELISGSEDSELRMLASMMEGEIRLDSSIGQPFELHGITVDGKPFDWESYRGKVVLVDFWATWCGPCIAESKNILQAYEQFHAKGFDVVGVSIDDDKDALEAYLAEAKYPWTTLRDQALNEDVDLKEGEDHTMSAYYGIYAVPTMILIDRDGKAIALDCRGSELFMVLEAMLGEPETK